MFSSLHGGVECLLQGGLRTLLVIALLSACGSPPPQAPVPVAPRPGPTVASALADLAQHLEGSPILVEPDDGLRIQGQLPAPRAEAAVARDRELFGLLVQSEAFSTKLERVDLIHVMALCDSLVATSEPTGLQCLSTMATTDRATHQWGPYLVQRGFGIAGAQGELLAVAVACESPDADEAPVGAAYLRHAASYDEAIAPIEACVEKTSSEPVRIALTYALGHTASPRARPHIDALLARNDLGDLLQTAAIWSFVELHGRSGLARLQTVVPVGDHARSELTSALEFLRTDTTDASPFGLETENDVGFYGRFVDLQAPVCDWLRAHQGDDIVHGRRPLAPDDKQTLFAALEAGAAFGLDAVKGSLFAVVDERDVPALLRIRRLGRLHVQMAPERLDHAIEILVKQARMRGK